MMLLPGFLGAVGGPQGVEAALALGDLADAIGAAEMARNAVIGHRPGRRGGPESPG